MKYSILPIIVLLSISFGYAQHIVNFYVSPAGNDAWNGRSPDQRQNSGPFRTLERANDEINKMNVSGKLSGKKVQVLIRKGVYEITKTLRMKNTGYLNPPASVTWKNYRQEKVECIGGSAIKGSIPVSDTDYLTRINNNYRQHIYEVNLKQNNIDDYGMITNRGPPRYGILF